MIRICYSEPDGPKGPACRIEAAGHSGYAPAGQDIVCAGVSTIMQALVYLLAGVENTDSSAWDEPDGPRLCVTAAQPQEKWVEGAFELAKAGFALLAERYPKNLRFEDTSRRARQSMLDLQMFADGAAASSGEGNGASAPALSSAQQRQAIASGTMKADAKAESASAPPAAEKAPAKAQPHQPQRPMPPKTSGQKPGQNPGEQAVRALHSRWAAEEAAIRLGQPDFSLQKELKNPEMRRLMRMPGMRMQDAYRLAHYGDQLNRLARAVEQGVLERIRQRSARPAENGTHPGSAAVMHTDVAHMTRAQREALEKEALHGGKITF